MDKITFYGDQDEKFDYYIIEQTRISGTNYILVTEDMENDDAEAYILKDISEESDTEAVYEFVEEDTEIQAVGKIFEELLEDMDLEL